MYGCGSSGVAVCPAPGVVLCGCPRFCSSCWCGVVSCVGWYGLVSSGKAFSSVSSSSISEYQSILCASVRCAFVTSCSLEVLPVSTVFPMLGFILLGLLLGTVPVLVGLLTLISRVATGFVALLLGSFGRCPVVCMHCFAVLVFALMLIVTSISLGWLGSVFGPFLAGFVGTCSMSRVLV